MRSPGPGRRPGNERFPVTLRPRPSRRRRALLPLDPLEQGGDVLLERCKRFLTSYFPSCLVLAHGGSWNSLSRVRIVCIVAK